MNLDLPAAILNLIKTQHKLVLSLIKSLFKHILLPQQLFLKILQFLYYSPFRFNIKMYELVSGILYYSSFLPSVIPQQQFYLNNECVLKSNKEYLVNSLTTPLFVQLKVLRIWQLSKEELYITHNIFRLKQTFASFIHEDYLWFRQISTRNAQRQYLIDSCQRYSFNQNIQDIKDAFQYGYYRHEAFHEVFIEMMSKNYIEIELTFKKQLVKRYFIVEGYDGFLEETLNIKCKYLQDSNLWIIYSNEDEIQKQKDYHQQALFWKRVRKINRKKHIVLLEENFANLYIFEGSDMKNIQVQPKISEEELNKITYTMI